jgi:hypothetical protein
VNEEVASKSAIFAQPLFDPDEVSLIGLVILPELIEQVDQWMFAPKLADSLLIHAGQTSLLALGYHR